MDRYKKPRQGWSFEGNCFCREQKLTAANWTPSFTEIKTVDDLKGPGAAPGTVPTDVEQATGLERLEILGKMESVDIFDMRPLDASRLGKG